MEKKTNNYIAVSYTLYGSADGKEDLVEKTEEGRPFEFISGFGAALDAFEQQVTPMAPGEAFDIRLTADQAFGPHDASQVIEVARSTFEVDGHFDSEHIFPDAIVPLQNNEGQRFFGRVVELTDASVTIDLNHPLAGADLHFVGKILENREATASEIESFVKAISGGCGGDCGGECDCEGDGCEGNGGGCGCGHCHH